MNDKFVFIWADDKGCELGILGPARSEYCDTRAM